MLPGTCDCSSPWSHSSISAGSRPPTYGRAIPTRADPAPDVYNLTIAKSDILKVERARADETFGRVLREADETDPVWIYKAFKDDVMVDVIFMVMGGIYLDDEMQSRSVERDYQDLRLRLPSPEDQIVIKAIVHREETSRHWFDALAILGRAQLDWSYLTRRGRVGARRLLALLIYAQSADILVPTWVIRRLYEEIYAQ